MKHPDDEISNGCSPPLQNMPQIDESESGKGIEYDNMLKELLQQIGKRMDNLEHILKSFSTNAEDRMDCLERKLLAIVSAFKEDITARIEEHEGRSFRLVAKLVENVKQGHTEQAREELERMNGSNIVPMPGHDNKKRKATNGD